MADETLAIKAGSDTDDLKNFIMQRLPDEQVRSLDLHYERSPSSGLAREPVILAVVITIKGGEVIGATVVGAVAALIAKWMDQRYDRERTSQIIEVYEEDPEKAKLLMKHLDKYENVAIKQERYLTKSD